jgi:basic membrane lipoprotein Med (substrate-binding protein (PBP1-ABC) superfamily)
VVLAVALAGCGSTHVVTTTVATTRAAPAQPPAGLRIGVVGDVPVPHVPGAVLEHGAVAQVAVNSLVLVAASAPVAARIASVAADYPSTYFALVGARSPDVKLANVAGLVVRDDAAAHLAGVVAGIVASDEGVQDPRVGWAGPQQPALADAFGRGVHEVVARAQILHSWSSSVPARCQEAALALVQRGAVAVLAPHGLCADAAALGAHSQNVAALSLDQFEDLSVPAGQVVRDAVAGVYHGGEDLVFGPKSGAVAIGKLDPRITTEQAIRARTLSGQVSG